MTRPTPEAIAAVEAVWQEAVQAGEVAPAEDEPATHETEQEAA